MYFFTYSKYPEFDNSILKSLFYSIFPVELFQSRIYFYVPSNGCGTYQPNTVSSINMINKNVHGSSEDFLIAFGKETHAVHTEKDVIMFPLWL